MLTTHLEDKLHEKPTVSGNTIPIPKHTRHIVERWFDPAADKTIKKIDTDSGLPNASGRFVTRMKIGPRCFNLCSFAASLALVELAGYSPPVPND